MGGDKGGGSETSVINTTPPWLSDLGKWSSDKFKEHMGNQENFSPYPEMSNPYGKWESLFGSGTGKDYLESFSAAPKAAYNQALTDTKNMFGAKGLYGSVGNGLMSGAMSSAAGNYATSMADAQQKAQNAQALDYYTSAEGQKWANQNKLDAMNYKNTMSQQLISNYLAGMGYAFPAISQGQTIVQEEGGGGMGGLGSILGGVGSLAGSIFSAKTLKEDKRPMEPVLDKVITLPVERWKYKDGIVDGGQHIGPYAEDWAERFGGSGKTINMIDAMGVLLKAVQELAERVKTLEQTNTGGLQHG